MSEPVEGRYEGAARRRRLRPPDPTSSISQSAPARSAYNTFIFNNLQKTLQPGEPNREGNALSMPAPGFAQVGRQLREDDFGRTPNRRINGR
jgi:hypothetical protein